MPKRCNFDDNIECFVEGCYPECPHHPLKKTTREKPKKHEKPKKALDTLGFIVAFPVFLIFDVLCMSLGIDIDFERLSTKYARRKTFPETTKELLIVIFGVMIGITTYSVGYIIRGWLFLVGLVGLIVLGIFVMNTLNFGWGHPKWYGIVYATFCFFWGAFWIVSTIWAVDADPLDVIPTFLVFFLPPLIPLWYLGYRITKSKRHDEM